MIYSSIIESVKLYMTNIKKIWSWLWPILLGIAFVVIAKTFFVQAVNISGDSMYPNLQNQEKVLCFKHMTIKRESVIVFDSYGVDPVTKASKLYVKRVIGIPGDTIQAKKGEIFVNGHILNQNFISHNQRTMGTGNWSLTSLPTLYKWINYKTVIRVPKNTYFCLGDNRMISRDSRYFGFVPRNKILGVVKAPLWIKNKQRRDAINRQWQTPFE